MSRLATWCSQKAHVATEEEGRALVDHQARKHLGISGEEFLRRWDAGMYRLADGEEAEKAARLSMLILFAGRTNA